MHIKDAAEKVGLSADTIRYYERIGLISPVKRQSSGIREFHQADLDALEFVKCFRSVGVSVDALISYMSLYRQGDGTQSERLAILQDERQKLQTRIDEQLAALERLDHKISTYQTSLEANKERKKR
ncbi:stress response transcriptional regulator NmlR [Streptococcus plurextorum]|uniref:stress response transcriptional regulator NmlR n=1 Tax=Streptococcus plurextorum TaxID=456876 RepID=UPI00041953B6|nr:stress response transcriptional regulator NmlR [Streptococcus plurextorum]